MTHPVHPSARARRCARRSDKAHRPSLEAIEARTLLTATLAPAPVLAAQSDTGVSNSDGITQDNGSASAPLTFAIPNANSNLYYSLYDNTNAASPKLLAGPLLMLLGNTITVSGTTLTDGVHDIAYTTASSASGTQSAFSQADAVTIETSLHVVSISPAANYLTGGAYSGNIVVTFSGDLSGLVPDKADGSGFASNPFAVMLVPSGPEGGAQYAKEAPLWSAPYGVDGGDLPLPAKLVYHQNADGTSTITLTPAEQLSTDIYLISIAGNLTDLAGNALTDIGGNAGTEYSSFDYHRTIGDTTPLAVTSVTADNGAIVINNNLIPQPDTIGITFNKPVDTWTANTDTVQLVAKSGSSGASTVASAVAYSPSTNTVYLTPEAALVPGTIYYVEVNTSLTDDQGLPNPGGTLAQEFITSFAVNAPGVGAGTSPLKVTATNPANGTLQNSPIGYGAVTFSEPIDLTSFSRYSAMLVPQTGGVTTGGSGYADVPLNAKLAFNPNTNQLIIVPTTGILPSNTVYLFALSGISATNGDTLGNSPAYSTFKLNFPQPIPDVAHPTAHAAAVALAVSTPAVPPVAAPPASPAPASTAGTPAVVITPSRPAQAVDQALEAPGDLIGRNRSGRLLLP